MSRFLIALMASLVLMLSACGQAGSESGADTSSGLTAEAEAAEDDAAKDEAATDVAANAGTGDQLTASQRRAAADDAEDRGTRNDVAAAPAPTMVAAARCMDCGTVSSIQPVKQKGEASGAGAIAGAIIGGVIGHQFGSGRGKDAATAGGAIAGGVAGHQIEKERGSTTYYKVTVAMDEGGTRTVNVGDPAGLTVGSKVRVIGNDLAPR